VCFQQPGKQLKVIKSPSHLKHNSIFRRWLLLLLLLLLLFGPPAGAISVCIPA
jgi:hypothetical protein